MPPAAGAQIVQLEMEKLSIQRSADTDKHAKERMHAIDDQLVMLKEEQQAGASRPNTSYAHAPVMLSCRPNEYNSA